jgi:DNA-directed RNA polymerase subunit RPC12/RpoP
MSTVTCLSSFVCGSFLSSCVNVIYSIVEKPFGCLITVTAFVILVCRNCGGFLAAKAEQKTKKCPYCGSRITLHKSKHIGSANSAREASTLLKILKRRKAEKRKP